MTRLTIRARLTLVYGGLFLLAGVVLLTATYALVSQQLPIRTRTIVGELPPGAAPGPQMQFMKVADDLRNDTLDALLTQGGIALAIVGIAATAFGWLIAGRMLQPLHRMTETARRIAHTPAPDRGLRERIAMTGPHDEVKELADTFDVMLAALDHSFDGQRRFIANASHELRTPLTINRALLEVAVHRGSGSPEVRQLADTLLEINARHERLIDGLLVLARSERQVGESSFVDLADIVEHVADQTPTGSVTVRVEAAEAPTTGNPVLLERLVQNLVENGVRHNTDTDGWVRVVSTTQPDGTALVQVSNTGPVVPRYEIPGLFEPFRRLAAERQATGGAGLGLSIVRAVAVAHGGAVYADPRDGGGLVVTVVLPGAPHERHVPNGHVGALPAATGVAGQH
ncbi:sensor histidine kinase [Actinokineospora sp. HUAS TT18]|uniref:sensor histidine kinase n=1 Tax=Actinokineospora sp. HUAS TT18 TaxID=3447451 RepID=UPI003F526124